MFVAVVHYPIMRHIVDIIEGRMFEYMYIYIFLLGKIHVIEKYIFN